MRLRTSLFQVLLGALTLFLAAALVGCGSHKVTAPLADAHATRAVSATTQTAPLAARVAESEDQNSDTDDFANARAIDGPTVITQPGAYRVTRDFAANPTTGDGIVIRSDDVRLWLGDHKLQGPGNKLGRGVVVDNANRVRVHGGHLSTFGIGVVLSGAHECVVRNVDVVGGDEFADPPNGVAPQIGIMLVNSASNRIARNHLHGINLGIFVRGGGSTGNRIHENQVVGLTHGLLGICYNPAPTGGTAGPSQDVVRGNELLRFGTGIVTSIGSQYNRFSENVIEYFTTAYRDFNGTNVFIHNRATKVNP